jgi:outer membrane protein assembly factor BamB
MLRLVCSFLLALRLAAHTQGADWPQFRGPNGDGIADAKNVPTKWTATEHVAWKRDIPGTGWSSPVVSNDRIYLTTSVTGEGEDAPVSLRAISIDANTGKIVWNVEAIKPDPAATKAVHSKNTLASPTPFVDGDRLYVHFGHLGMAALDRDGNILWRQTTITYPPVHGNGGSPVVAEGALIFSCDAAADPFVVALETSTGDVRWKTPRKTSATKTFSFSTPAVIDVDGVRQVVSPGSGMVAAYSPRDGREIWRVGYDEGYSVVPRPVFAHGLLFVSSGFNDPQVLAIDPQGAQGDVTLSNVVWTHERGAPLTPSLLVVADELYMVSDNGVATCLDARTHKVHWTKRLGGDFSASPVYAAGHVYFTNEGGVTHVVKAGTTFESVAKNDVGERTLASLAIVPGAIILRSESSLRRIAN